MTPDPDLDDASQVLVHRAMMAVQREFADDPQIPRFVMTVELPPEGRLAIASTGDDEIDTHRILLLAAASIRTAMEPATLRKARRLWAREQRKFLANER